MEFHSIFATLISSIPVFSTLICFLIIALSYRNSNNDIEYGLKKILTVYFLSSVLVWFSILSFHNFPNIFIHINAICYLSFLLVPITFYHFIYNMTKIGNSKKFPLKHYYLPIIISLSLFIWSFFVPFDIQLEIVANKGETIGEYKQYSYFFTSKIAVRCIFSAVYIILAIIRLHSFRKKIRNYSANEELASIPWLNVLLIISVLLMILPIMSLMTSKITAYNSIFMVLTVALLIYSHIVLCYNVVMKRYLIFSKESFETEQYFSEITIQEQKKSVTNINIDKNRLEQYFETHKPYLNPDLKITDLTKELGINRTYLSNFINQSYGMNFSRFVNLYRLKELKELMEEPRHTNAGIYTLIQQAGFGSYRSYLRIKKDENIKQKNIHRVT